MIDTFSCCFFPWWSSKSCRPFVDRSARALSFGGALVSRPRIATKERMRAVSEPSFRQVAVEEVSSFRRGGRMLLARRLVAGFLVLGLLLAGLVVPVFARQDEK